MPNPSIAFARLTPSYHNFWPTVAAAPYLTVCVAWPRQSPNHSLNQCKCRNCGSVRAQDARAERYPDHFWSLEQCRPFLVGKTPFRADQYCQRRPLGRMRTTSSALIGSFTSASSSQNTRWRRGHCEEAIERQRIGDIAVPQDAALLRRLDHIGAHAIEIDALTWVCRVITGWSREAPISTAFCTM